MAGGVLRIGGRSYGPVDQDDEVLLSSAGIEVNGERHTAR